LPPIESKKRKDMRRESPALKGTETVLDENKGRNHRIAATLEKISTNL
jgi:ribosomal protein L32